MASDSIALIRPYHLDDEPQVVALWHACGLTRPSNDPHCDIALKLALQPDLLLVAEREGCIVGSVMAGYEGHRGWINYLAVDPGSRHRGLGRSLMRQAEEKLRALGCPKINLQVRKGNADVLAFYEAIGFTEDAVVSMGKRLS